jgi:hypothetical protein
MASKAAEEFLSFLRSNESITFDTAERNEVGGYDDDRYYIFDGFKELSVECYSLRECCFSRDGSGGDRIGEVIYFSHEQLSSYLSLRDAGAIRFPRILKDFFDFMRYS